LLEILIWEGVSLLEILIWIHYKGMWIKNLPFVYKAKTASHIRIPVSCHPQERPFSYKAIFSLYLNQMMYMSYLVEMVVQ
jgi:hypothetical protein